MNILILSGSNIGNKTCMAMEAVYEQVVNHVGEDHQVKFLNLQSLDVQFSDGRNFLDYTGDTGDLLKAVMASDILFIGSPVFQASIPASLKNVFDLLPQRALEGKTVAMVMTAGSHKHYLIPEIQLKPILSYLKATIVPNYVFVHESAFDHNGIRDDDLYFRIDTLVEETLLLADALQIARDKQEDLYGF